jgi:hypothetical protein
VRFQILMVVMNIFIFWDVRPNGLVGIYRRFGKRSVFICILYTEDLTCTFLLGVCKHLPQRQIQEHNSLLLDKLLYRNTIEFVEISTRYICGY